MRKKTIGLIVVIAALVITVGIGIGIVAGEPTVQPEVLDHDEIEMRRPLPMPHSVPFPREIHQEIDTTSALAGLVEPAWVHPRVSSITSKDIGFEVTLTDDVRLPMDYIGKPIVPYIVKRFEIPRDSEVESVSVNLSDPFEIHNIFIEPAPKPPRAEYVIDNETYSSSEPYPGKKYDYKVLDHIKWKEVVVHVFPLQYIPAKSRVIGYKNASISISLTPPPSALSPRRLGGEEYECVIVTHPNFVDECERLADWKNDTGISTRVVDTTWINNNFAGFDGIDNDLQAKIKQHACSVK